MHIAILLTWIRHNYTGGIESYIRNLLDGFCNEADNNKYTLICAQDNVESFMHYKNDKRFDIITCPVISHSVIKTIIYENREVDKIVSSIGADFCFVPSYRMPVFGIKNKYLIVIHDIQSIHFPQIFSWHKRTWQRIAWMRCVKKAKRIVAISQFDKDDIVKNIDADPNKVDVIYNPILPSLEFADYNEVKKKYNIGDDGYFYCVAAMAKHKNLITIIKMMGLIKKQGQSKLPSKLLISGAFYKSDYAEEIKKYIEENNLTSDCIFTGYVSNGERNTLIKNTKLFLFPSMFEGFGMPVVESLQLGTTVLTTKCASILEVSKKLAIYVDNPTDEYEWLEKAEKAVDKTTEPVYFEEYAVSYSTRKYLNLFEEICK